ncbi:Fatty acid synthase subunit beta [Pseudozyma hubeiensis]|nr:Fatty acid synthase subunit beta [Pseudozyma hubeiensis]
MDHDLFSRSSSISSTALCSPFEPASAAVSSNGSPPSSASPGLIDKPFNLGATVSQPQQSGELTVTSPTHPGTSIRLYVPFRDFLERHYIVQVRDAFVQHLATLEHSSSSHGSTIDVAALLARLLLYLAQHLSSSDPLERHARLCFLEAAWSKLNSDTLGSIDVHSYARSLSQETASLILRAYFEAYAALHASGVPVILRTPSLLESARTHQAGLYALFGGQGNNHGYFAELQALFDTYRPFVEPIVAAVTARFSQLLCRIQAARTGPYAAHSQGLDLLSWLQRRRERPTEAYLASVPISAPLLSLTQMIQFYVTAKCSGMSVPQFRSHFQAVSGHSQGIVSATAMAMAVDDEHYIECTVLASEFLFQIGITSQLCYGDKIIDDEAAHESTQAGFGPPSPMLVISAPDRAFIEQRVSKFNSVVPGHRRIYIALVNAPTTAVLAGHASDLVSFARSTSAMAAPAKLDQARVPFSKRKPSIRLKFLPINLPYHSPLLASVEFAQVVAPIDMRKWQAHPLAIPVHSTTDGANMQQLSSSSILESLLVQMCTAPVDWIESVRPLSTTTHLIDFGTGGAFGIGNITARNLRGRGLSVLTTSGTHKQSADFYRLDPPARAQDWESKYQPRLVRTSQGRLMLDTPMSRLLGKPPIMIAGMTPTTVQASLNAATMRAGYHIELAGGGLHDEAKLRARVQEILSQAPAASGFTLNSLYINPRQWGFQLPAWLQLSREGAPVDGLCVAAGIPSPEKAQELLTSLKQAGLRHVSFKPGSLDAIKQVCKIAQQNPSFPILLQWTGGRAGGHHSAEDFHDPIIQSYDLIRACPNLVLVAGSGFTSAESFWPYLSGQWSVERGLPPMPFDGVLFGSWAMTAKEASTSLPVKQLIASTQGCSDKDWQTTYDAPIGGITTVLSEMGELVHQVANRATLLWSELDRDCFKLSKEKQLAYLTTNKERLVQRLNDDFQRVWFARGGDGQVLYDVQHMTYAQVASRMLSLMFVTAQSRWIDVSYRNLLGDWCRRIEERFSGSSKTYHLQSYAQLDHSPHVVLQALTDRYAGCKDTLLTSEDVEYFHSICWRRGQKPPPFITRLGDDFAHQFKKDSLWQSEDLDAVVEADPQRVCILHGPVAASNSAPVDQPIAEMLGGVEQGLIKHVLNRFYGGDTNNVPVAEYLDTTAGGSPATVGEMRSILQAVPSTIKLESDESVAVYSVSSASVENPTAFLDAVIGEQPSWIRALVRSSRVNLAGQLRVNPLRRLLSPREGQLFQVHFCADGRSVKRLQVYGGHRSYGKPSNEFLALDIVRRSVLEDDSQADIDVSIYEERSGLAIPLLLQFQYKPGASHSLIREVEHGRNDRIRRFYWKTWFDEDMPANKGLDAARSFVTEPRPISSSQPQDGGAIAVDTTIAAGWEAIMKTVVSSCDADLLSLVHLGHEFQTLADARPVALGDVCSVTARASSITNSETGKILTVKATISRVEADDVEAIPVAVVTSRFFYKGRYTDHHRCFSETDFAFSVVLEDQAAVQVLKSKQWLELKQPSLELEVGTTLIFRGKTVVPRYRSTREMLDLQVHGNVFVRNGAEEVGIGLIEYEADTPLSVDPVVAYLERSGSRLENADEYTTVSVANAYKLGEGVLATPPTNEPYSQASADFNPIHVNPYFADLAGLPATIGHGMSTFAECQKWMNGALRSTEAHGKVAVPRCTAFKADFTAMVIPGDQLSVQLRHKAMSDGQMVVQVDASNQRGELVLQGIARYRQPRSVYVFTGQGSQSKGMGMELYQQSATARAIWDEAEQHLAQRLGLSILEIVRDNPKTKTVYFGGAQGQQIRKNYMALQHETVDEHGRSICMPIFPSIHANSRSYTFESPKGLLFATQFTQIALVLFELAYFRHLQHKGVIVEEAVFAGHSLGEYAALASVAGMMRLCDLVDVVFYRGLTMQSAVPRINGKSDYGMVAVAAIKAFPKIDDVDAALAQVVDRISRQSGLLLQVVNYNVRKQQSVVAGHEVALAALSVILDKCGSKTLSFTNDADVDAAIKAAVDHAQTTAKTSSIELKRGIATIPLAGIDVPFHSRFLSNGIDPFRRFLDSRLDIETVKPEELVDRYIPNLVAKVFSLERDYIEHVAEVTRSQVLLQILDSWDQASLDRRRLARTLVIELLAYQFASPVRWSETQTLLFQDASFERLVEFGPTPTLVGMASKTLAADYADRDRMLGFKRILLCVGKNDADIMYNIDVVEEANPNEGAQETTSSKESGSVAAAAPAADPVLVAAPAAAPQVAAPALDDERLDALLTVRAIVAQKQKAKIADISPAKSIKQLTGGRSTLQNELIGDLGAEFVDLPERAEELTLEELAAALRPGYRGELGKYTNGLIARLAASKLPGSFGLTALKAHLVARYGFQSGRTTAVLLYTMTEEPAKRLSGDAEAIAWIESVASVYAKDVSITLPGAGGGANAGGATSGATAVVSSKELVALQAKMKALSEKQVQVLNEHLGVDADASLTRLATHSSEVASLRNALDSVSAEHGDIYIKGVQGIFAAAKARTFKSYWNWSRQNLEELFVDILQDRVGDDRALLSRVLRVWNQLDDVKVLQQQLSQLQRSGVLGCEKVTALFEPLLRHAESGALKAAPRFVDLSRPLRPHTRLDARGNIVYEQLPRDGADTVLDYVLSMASSQESQAHSQKITSTSLIDRLESLVQNDSPADDAQVQDVPIDSHPALWAGSKVNGAWSSDDHLTEVYFRGLAKLATAGSSYAGLDVLLTGVGQGSIAFEVMRRFLQGGARVIVTTSTFSPGKIRIYQETYRRDGARGAQLTVLLFNQGSFRDVQALVDHVYNTMGIDIDVLVPFAAISENGRNIDGIDDKSELAHRIMLTNVIRLMGCIKNAKDQRGFVHRPTQVLLPLSFNHGVLGGDGLYGPSKIGLETLLNTFESEDWSNFFCMAGARIGMCRGTDLMGSSDIVAESLETKSGCRTFSTGEMALNLLGLVEPEFVSINQTQPILLDLTGRASLMTEPGKAMRDAHQYWQRKSDIKKALLSEGRLDFKAMSTSRMAEDYYRRAEIEPRSLHHFAYPKLDSQQICVQIAKSSGPIDLDQVIVISGFAEVGPWGSSRTRWEREVDDKWSLEGLVEMAWLTGHIKHFNGRLADGRSYVGWIDAKTGEPVTDSQMRARYARQLEQHAGIRLVEPELMHGFDPERKVLQQEVELTHDLGPLEVSAAEAERFRLAHGDHAVVWQEKATDSWYLKLKKGASVFVPKARRFDRHVAGQLPTGWDPARYGIPSDIVAQTDETALYALVCIAEALVQSGIDDPYELYKHVHVSEVGTSLGSAMGGLHSLAKMFKDRRDDVEVQNDVLQETFINTVAGWTNLLLLSSCGPIKPTVGACATALQSLDVAAETIRCGKAKIMIAGGYESISEESMTEFANMKATASSDAAFAAGLAPEELSKPMTSGRSGFVEAQGCGVQIVMSAATALKIGAPINGIVAFTQTATDRQGRSIPAPGKGVLSATVPLKRAMSSWGLDGNDVGIISMHGTSTKANDKNESNVYHTMLGKLGRAEGCAVPAMAQKWLCGHGKGGAAAWAINGLMQSINDGIVAGNRNADDIAGELRDYNRVFYPCRSIRYDRQRLHAGLVTSFGFGQVGGIAMILHASHVLGKLDRETLEVYRAKRDKRQQITYRRMHSLFTQGDLVRIKDEAPYAAEHEVEVLLDIEARAKRSRDGSYRIVPSTQA